MATITSEQARRKPASVETPRLPLFDGRPQPPADLAPRRISGDSYAWPEELLDENPTPSARKVFRFLDETVRHTFGRRTPGLWMLPSTIAREMQRQGVKIERRTVLTALAWLERKHWITRAPGFNQGQEVAMIWCRWLLPGDWAGAAPIDFGQGVKFDLDAERYEPAKPDRLISSGPDRADFGAGRADATAPKSAPEGSNEFKNRENVNVSEAAPVRKRPPDPEPIAQARPPATVATDPDPRPILNDDSVAPAAPVPPPPPPARVKLTRDECLAGLAAAEASGLLRFPATVSVYLWDLADQGHQADIPPRFRGERMPPRLRDDPQPEATRRPAAAARPPAPATTIELIRRLADPAGPEAIQDRLDQIADRLADEFDDFGWWHGFRKRAMETLESPKVNPIKALVNAYKAARKSNTAESKGAIFMSLHNKITKRAAFNDQEGPRAT